MTAAMGMPKLEAGPQKSVPDSESSAITSLDFPTLLFSIEASAGSQYWQRNQVRLTGRAKVIRHGIGPDAGIEGFDRRRHGLSCPVQFSDRRSGGLGGVGERGRQR